MGYTKPTPIQEQTIPLILEDKDLIACAQTGTGKTASYLLPVLQKMSNAKHRHLNTLVLAPTRELAQQIDQQVEGLAYFTGISSIAVYGGGDGGVYEQQRKGIMQGADILIATPGRLISFLVSGIVKFEHLEHLILDEADRMLDMGFFEDILRIITYLPVKRQTLLFSATMPTRIRELAKRILQNPQQVNIATSQPAVGIDQQAYLTFDEQKNKLLVKILKDKEYKSVLIFSSTKEKVKQLHQQLRKIGINAEAFHSDLEQDNREQILRAFKARQLPVIIGTDVLARGIDVEGISLVLNYDVPPDPEDYIHRIGRTARAETTGTAITFINEKDQRKFHSIETMIGREIRKVPLPDGMGDGPAYQPGMKRSNHTGHTGGRSGASSGSGRSSGGRSGAPRSDGGRSVGSGKGRSNGSIPEHAGESGIVPAEGAVSVEGSSLTNGNNHSEGSRSADGSRSGKRRSGARAGSGSVDEGRERTYTRPAHVAGDATTRKSAEAAILAHAEAKAIRTGESSEHEETVSAVGAEINAHNAPLNGAENS